MQRDLLLFGGWLVVIGLCLLFGRRVDHWFEGGPGLAAGAFLIICGVIAAALVARRVLRLPPSNRLKAAWGVLGAAAGLAALAWVQPLLIERTHLLLYGVLAFLTYNLAGHWSEGGRRALWAGLICVTAGVLDEVGQFLHPARVGEPRDALTNGAAAVLTVWAVWLSDTGRAPEKTAAKSQARM
ncbi:MAG: VanZ family protein [Desulfarculaceae bacterium]|jgi:VanZ family protein